MRGVRATLYEISEPSCAASCKVTPLLPLPDSIGWPGSRSRQRERRLSSRARDFDAEDCAAEFPSIVILRAMMQMDEKARGQRRGLQRFPVIQRQHRVRFNISARYRPFPTRVRRSNIHQLAPIGALAARGEWQAPAAW
jgi:hypothetical protein